MGLVDRYLAALFGLLALVGLAVALPRGEGAPRRGAPLDGLAREAGGWVAVEGAPEEILPSDPRALEAVRRTYARGGQTLWLTVARYRARNDPQWRPSLTLIVPERGAISIRHELLRMTLDGVAGRTAPVHLLSLRRPDRRIWVFYWYQLGDQPIADEYRLRLQLFMDTLLFRRRELLFVRMATASSERPDEFFRAFYRQLTSMRSS